MPQWPKHPRRSSKRWKILVLVKTQTLKNSGFHINVGREHKNKGEFQSKFTLNQIVSCIFLNSRFLLSRLPQRFIPCKVRRSRGTFLGLLEEDHGSRQTRRPSVHWVVPHVDWIRTVGGLNSALYSRLDPDVTVRHQVIWTDWLHTYRLESYVWK